MPSVHLVPFSRVAIDQRVDKYPSWTRSPIGTRAGGDDLQPGDINSDGAVDVVVNGGEIVWYENPRGSGGDLGRPWVSHTIDATTGSHDLAVGDVNGDGRMDVVIRQALGRTILYLQRGPDAWTRVPLPNTPDGQGRTSTGTAVWTSWATGTGWNSRPTR